jgi:hypothetical protein
MWKLIRVAFMIKSGEMAREGVAKAVPVIVRPVIKRFYSKGVLAAGRGLPFVGKFLLQRNVIKVGIPVVGVPLAMVLNRYTTLLAGRHAQAVFRGEARVIELAEGLSKRSQHPQLMLWVARLVIMADHKRFVHVQRTEPVTRAVPCSRGLFTARPLSGYLITSAYRQRPMIARASNLGH